ncbi:MAG: TlpA family protein disulfide reductase [Desertimonas sp.]
MPDHDEPGSTGGPPAADTAETAETDVAGASPRRPGRLAPFVVVIVAALLAGLFVVLAGSEPTSNESADTYLMNRPAPEAAGTTGSGDPFELGRRRGSWVVLNFFTSDCVPCIQEHPELVAFSEQQASLGAQGAELYTVVYDDDRPRVEAFFDEHGGDWPVVYDDRGAIAVNFGVSKVPETWIIDPYGVVRARYISRVTADFLAAQLQALREAL